MAAEPEDPTVVSDNDPFIRFLKERFKVILGSTARAIISSVYTAAHALLCAHLAGKQLLFGSCGDAHWLGILPTARDATPVLSLLLFDVY